MLSSISALHPVDAGTVAEKKVGPERMVTSWVSGELLGWPLSVGSWLRAGKNSRLNHSKVKEGLFREKHTPQTECGPSQKARETPGNRVVSFYRGG